MKKNTFIRNSAFRAAFPRLAVLIILTALLALSGCTSPTEGIFYSLAQEKKIENKGLDDNLSVNGIFRFNDYLFLSAGSNWKLDTAAADGSWTSVQIPGTLNGKQVLAADAAELNGVIYSAFYNYDSTPEGLFTTSDLSGSVSWSKVAEDFGGKKIDRLMSVNSVLFVSVTADNRTFGLYYSTDGVTFTDTSLAEPRRFTDIAFDGSKYWLVSTSSVYSATDAAGGPDSFSKDSTVPGTGYGGIEYIQSATKLFLSGTDGYIYVKDTATDSAWTKSTQVTSNDTPVSFYDFAYYPQKDVLFVGTDSNGLYEIPSASTASPANAESPVVAASGYSYSGLSTFPVIDVFVDTAGGSAKLFAGTAQQGLWEFDLTAADGVWAQE